MRMRKEIGDDNMDTKTLKEIEGMISDELKNVKFDKLTTEDCNISISESEIKYIKAKMNVIERALEDIRNIIE